MTPENLQERLSSIPRLPYITHPTPLQPLTRLRDQLPEAPALWIKRDDEVGPGLGGNKGRPLSYLMAEAVKKGSHKVVTYGGLQSNHARMTAAACAQLGLEAHLFFFRRHPARMDGNLLLNQLLGAKMHFIPFGESDEATMTLERTIRLVRLVSFFVTGPGAYFIPGGGHNVTGCLGYLQAAVEKQQQIEALTAKIASVSTAQTVFHTVPRETVYASWNRGFSIARGLCIGPWTVDDQRTAQALIEGHRLIADG